MSVVKCTQCGKCCKSEVCLIGQLMFEVKEPPCPALEYDGDKYWCGVVLYADVCMAGLSKHFGDLLGVGKGCGIAPASLYDEKRIKEELEDLTKKEALAECKRRNKEKK